MTQQKAIQRRWLAAVKAPPTAAELKEARLWTCRRGETHYEGVDCDCDLQLAKLKASLPTAEDCPECHGGRKTHWCLH